jgi:hypothetical protein
MAPVTAGELDRLLTNFTRDRLPAAREQLNGIDLHFVRAGSQATLLAGSEPIGLVTIRQDDVEFDPPLPAGRTEIGRSVSESDLWAWVIAAWNAHEAQGPV